MKGSYILLFITFILFEVSCNQKNKYERLVNRELKKGVRHDSLFLGYHFGMDSQEFLDYSWKLNKKGIITGKTIIVHELDNFSNDATMKFYPSFKGNQIYRMPVEISYDAWAPWNKELFADSLMLEIVDRYKKTYGENFIKTTLPENGKEAWINVKGNRRIAVFKKNDSVVQVEFLDLLAVNRGS